MPLYFFDVQGHENKPDDTGTQLADDNTARLQAVMFTATYLRDHPEFIWDGREMRVRVRKANGAIVFTTIVLAVDSA